MSIVNIIIDENGRREVELTAAEEQELLDQMHGVLRQYGLDDWIVTSHDRLTGQSLGDCSYEAHTIRLLRNVGVGCPTTVRRVWSVFFHELAHALDSTIESNEGRQHGAIWHRLCVMLGGDYDDASIERYGNKRIAADRKDAATARYAQTVLTELQKRGRLSDCEIKHLLRPKTINWSVRRERLLDRRLIDVTCHLVYKMKVAECDNNIYHIRLGRAVKAGAQ
jgi:hypothetical protein